MTPYTILYRPTVVSEDIPLLPKTMRLRIKTAIETRLTDIPEQMGKPLQYGLAGFRRLRVGDYRIIYSIDTNQRIVTIHEIGHRKLIYES